MMYHMARYNIHALQTSMNQLSNHDHSRFLTRTSGKTGRLHTVGRAAAEADVDKRVMKEAVVFMMTWPGAPTLYYGDEAGLCGWTDPDNRRVFPWGKEDEELLQFHREAIALRQKNTALRTGSVQFLHNEQGVLSFGRWDEQSNFAVALNNNDVERALTLPVWKMGCASGTMRVVLATVPCEAETFPVEDGKVQLILPAKSAVVLEGVVGKE